MPMLAPAVSATAVSADDGLRVLLTSKSAELDVEQARDLAAQLTAAADRIERAS